MTDSVEAFLNRLHHPMLASIDLSLDRMHRLLAMLGSPQKRLPPVIHVAGTNGKGSLLAYLQAIFQAAGLRVHRYTSPHLVHFRERIILQGREIDDRYLETILKHVSSTLASQPATFFEATTAAAFLAFAEKPADVLLLETGLGGRLDATNVIEKPLLTAITPISIDHTEYLGTTIPAIAGEKAGIIKRGVPCVIGRQEAEAAAVLQHKAENLSAPLFRMGHEWNMEQGEYRSPTLTLKLNPSLKGAFQFDNAATAVACIEQLPQYNITAEHIHQGLSGTVWPARLQHLNSGAFAKAMPQGVQLWLDGGHNPQGGQMLADWLAAQHNPEVYLICGMMKGKDPALFLKPLAPYARALYAVAIPSETGAQTPQAIAAAANAVGLEASVAPSVENALQTAVSRAKTGSIICICGSLYLAGKILARN